MSYVWLLMKMLIIFMRFVCLISLLLDVLGILMCLVYVMWKIEKDEYGDIIRMVVYDDLLSDWLLYLLDDIEEEMN